MADPETFGEADRRSMRRAVELARRGRGFVEPNPMVGCVLTRDGQIIGEGFHREFGGPHAEVEALANAKAKIGGNADQATAYVTLEPCCHHGKTPPCSAALINANVARVVVGTVDPFSKVDGGGLRQLREAGISVAFGCLQSQCDDLIAPFRKRVTTGLPWVTAKWAMTIDGRIATSTGSSRWITSSATRRDVHLQRAASDGILVGMGTVRADDPELSVRIDAGADADDHRSTVPNRPLHRMVVCRTSLPSPTSRLVRSIERSPLHIVAGLETSVDQRQVLESMGATVHVVEKNEDLAAASIRIAGDIGMTHLIVEGGQRVLGSFFDQNLVDQCDVYVGAKVFGGEAAFSPVGGIGVRTVDDAKPFDLHDVQRFQQDIKLTYRRVKVGRGVDP